MNSKNASAKPHRMNPQSQSKPMLRRKPPAESTSLPAYKKKELLRPSVNDRRAQDPAAQTSGIPNEESRDSNGSDASAGKWFDKANRNGPQGQREETSPNGESSLCTQLDGHN